MELTGWRDRLADALAKSGKSKRAASVDAGLGVGYVHSILSEGKDPSIEHLAKVCAAIGTSMAWVLYGFEISPQTERLMRIIEGQPEKRDSLISLLEVPPTPTDGQQ